MGYFDVLVNVNPHILETIAGKLEMPGVANGISRVHRLPDPIPFVHTYAIQILLGEGGNSPFSGTHKWIPRGHWTWEYYETQ
jgi:hypothetical protein